MNIRTELPPEVKKGQFVSLDFEVFGQEKGKLHRPTGTFACISVAIEGDSNVYQLYDSNDLKKLFQLTKKGIPVYHNALYDMRQFRRYVPKVSWNYIHDTMLVDQSMQGGYYQTFSLGDLSRRWLGKVMDKEVREDFAALTEMTPQMKRYAAKDAQETLKIALKQRDAYEGHPAFKAYTVADEPMILPVLDLQGFRVDVEGWEKMVAEFQKTSDELEEELGINVMSPQQVKLKAKELGLHLQSTGAEVLMEFGDEPFIQQVITARMYRKAVSTYGLKWLDAVEDDGKVYASYNITGASATGRMSCSNPNLQQIPSRKLPQYRDRFMASEGHVIEVSDIAQQEPCITAYHTQDANLLSAIRNKEDLHLAVARKIFNDDTLTKEKDADKRAVGKVINLGSAYGLSSFGMASKLGITEEKASAFLSQYFRHYGGVLFWIGQQRQQGYANGYVSSALGRRSYLNTYDRKWENNAINSPIQGGAADFTKIWVRKVWEKSHRAGIPYTIVAMVHDEIVRDIPRECLKESKQIQNEAFQETAEQLYPGVPFTLESEYGRAWSAKSLHEEMEDEIE